MKKYLKEFFDSYPSGTVNLEDGKTQLLGQIKIGINLLVLVLSISVLVNLFK